MEYYSSQVLKFFRRIAPEIEFVRYCKTNNVEVFTTEVVSYKSLGVLSDNPTFLESMESSLISFFAESGPFNGKRYERVKFRYFDICCQVFEKTLDILEKEKSITTVYVPNGRMADQKTFVIASTHQNPAIKIIYFEKGYLDNFYYVGENSLLDRVEMQSAIRQSNYYPLLSLASAFFDSRRVDERVNEYIAGWKDDAIEEDIQLSTKRVTFFNSSNDEFMSLGTGWNDSEWISQWAAFDEIAHYLLKNDYDITLRMHPNGANKSRRERSRERLELDAFRNKFPTIIVFEPQEKVNSYNLIKQSDLIVVWNSTIGLEACYMGKPVVCLNSSEWDLSIPNFRARHGSDLQNLIQVIPKANPDDALKYIAGRISLDKPLRSNDIRSIYLNLEKNDFVYRLARISAGSRKFRFRNIFKIFFSSNSTALYKYLKRLSAKFQGNW